MDSLIKSDIFFFISSIAVIVLSVGAAIVLAYGIRILRDVKRISEAARTEGELIVKDIAKAREQAGKEGIKVGLLVKSVKKIIKKLKNN